MPRTVLLLDPSVSTSGQIVEVSNATVTTKGVAMDPSGLPVVTINGSPANMKPRSAQAVNFWSDPVNLKPGDNSFEVIAINPAKGEAKFQFVARLTPPPAASPPAAPSPNPKALSKTEILDLLGSYVPSARVGELVKGRGIKFAPSDDDLKQVRDAGGSDDLIEALKEAAAKH